MSRVIINGDDFGMTGSCSRAIARAFRDGLITDTTMMATGGYFDEAVALARAQGFSDKIGIHFNLTEGEPLTGSIKGMPDFVTDGRFRKGDNLSRPLSETAQAAVYEELSAQARRIEEAGIRITHADSHHYIHNSPAIAPIVARVCREHGIKKIRLYYNIGAKAEGKLPNDRWNTQGFRTTAYFGRISDIIGKNIPDSLEVIVHPDFDRNGILIDRTGMVEGFPVGNRLPDLSAEHDVELISYAAL